MRLYQVKPKSFAKHFGIDEWLIKVRDALLDSEAESSGDSAVDEGSISDGHQSEEADTSSSQNANLKEGEGKEPGKEDEMEVELDQEAEEWGLKKIGDYDLEDEFIDDSEVHHYFKNVNKESKYSGFYIHKVRIPELSIWSMDFKGPLKLTEQKPEGKAPKKGKGGDGKTKATNGATAKTKASSNDKVRLKFFVQDSDFRVKFSRRKQHSNCLMQMSKALQEVDQFQPFLWDL